MTDLNKEREAFEKLSEIAEILNEEKSHFNGDFYDLPFNSCAESFINGAWYAWQEKAKAQAVQQSFEIGRLQDRITELLDERQDLYAQINNDQAVPTWISVKDEEPPTDTMVLICWSDSPDVQPEIDYMTCDEDLNHIWANFEIDPPTHWMYFHKVPSESGAEQ
ncbi:DUF551 domain-containing protein [Acinetobacter baumannii]|uniref:DUF551 domain-containing protein n=1 Tax=Acinetobacter baumannii TaxID=470 RepID=UPI00396C950E